MTTSGHATSRGEYGVQRSAEVFTQSASPFRSATATSSGERTWHTKLHFIFVALLSNPLRQDAAVIHIYLVTYENGTDTKSLSEIGSSPFTLLVTEGSAHAVNTNVSGNRSYI